MTRIPALLLTLAVLAFSGCEKVKPLMAKFRKKTTPAPQTAIVVSATPAPANDAAPKAKAPLKPARPAIDMHAQVVVLCYHRLEGRAGGSLSIEAALFEKQMQEIKDAGLAVISMADFLAWRRGEKNIPPKSILITIDDGYVSGYDVGVPILKKFGYPATFFVYTNYINSGGKSLNWRQLEELRDSGFEIGSHTVSHPLDLRKKPASAPGDYDSWLRNELEHSKKLIEQHLGIRCATVAYPSGSHNQKVHDFAKAAGYEAGFTVEGQRLTYSTHAFTLGRYDVKTRDKQGRDSFSVGISFTGMLAASAEPQMSQETVAAMVTQPMNNEIVRDQKPVIKANLATMGDLDPASVRMLIGGVGQVPARYDADSGTISYTPAQPLPPGQYSVIVSGKSGGQRSDDVRWSFTVDPNAQPNADGSPTIGVEPPPAKPAKR